MVIQKFEDIIAWQKARILTAEIYKLTSNCRDYGFKDQIQRATVSVMNNIAEGFDRQTDKDFRHFLYIAKGSAAEVRSMLFLALDLKYIDQDVFGKLYQQVSEIGRLLLGFIRSLKGSCD